MSIKSHSSFLILCLAFSFPLFPQSAYPAFDWETVENTDYAQVAPPKGDEKVRSFQGALIAGNWILWPAILPGENGKESHGVILRNFKNGDTKRIDFGEPVRGLAWDKEKNQIFARLKKEIVVIDADSFETKRRFSFPATNSGWTSLGFFQGKLFGIQGNTFTFYDRENGNEIESKEMPVSKIALAYACSEKEIFLWNNDGDFNLHSYNPILNSIKDRFSVKIDGKLAPKLTCRGKDFALMDPEKGYYQNLIQIGNQFYPVVPGNQILKRNLSYRFAPKKEKISFSLTVSAKEKDSPESEIAVAIPPKETASQILSEESVTKFGSFQEDAQGNRTLFVQIPALSAGQSWTEVVYSAKIERFNLDSGLSNFNTSWEDWKVDRKWNQFLEDKSVFLINDPGITSIRDQLKAESSSVEGYIQAVYKHITKNLVYKQDGRFDAAPTVLQNGHGSCTEHSYAQIALLRSAGIPARLAWNWLPVSPKVELNHKIAEVWHPSFGWIPMEPLSSPRTRAGLTYAKHIIFAVLNSPSHSIIKGGDVLLNFTKPSGGASRSLEIELSSDDSVSSRNLLDADSSWMDSFPKVKPISNRVLLRGDERSVE
ncbi:transglutaminase-like domain-containing protein [Leptospira stimsonii]|uniref:Transglutaminase n=1 Tax=Leptospira stimsonii TaxID=2202203 RepID=A0ABY2N1T6_9LEPT|nr:transglutaminase domain-containing protein [Leptospira stimsonii]TGK20652.1 transglutaminase [Leptospira stimsonii]TGM14440.1 transglutaminase [Leptospira stimsonii]